MRRRIETYNRWKFRGPAKGEVNGLLLAVKEGEVVGQLGLIPVKLKYGNNIFDAQWTCDLMVLPEMRKAGIGTKLFNAGMKRDVISIGNNPSPAADAVMNKLGFKSVSSGRTMIFPINSEHILKWAFKGKFKFAIPVLNKLVQPYFSLKQRKLKKSKTDFESCNWEDVVKLVHLHEERISDPHILHDEKFLEWRSAGTERYPQKIDAASSIAGSYMLYSTYKPYMNIYEWHCENSDELKGMITFILNEALKTKSEIIQLIANSDEEEGWLSSLGFVKARNIEKIIHYSEKKILDNAEKFYFNLYDTDLQL